MQKLSFLPLEKLTPIWTPQEQSDVCAALNLRHSSFLDEEGFKVIGGHNKEQVQLCVSLKKHNGSSEYPIECLFIKDSLNELNYLEAVYIILDYIDKYWAEYLSEDRAVYIPIDWNEHECESLKFFLRGWIRNLDLEMQADAFLQSHGHGEYEIQPISFET